MMIWLELECIYLYWVITGATNVDTGSTITYLIMFILLYYVLFIIYTAELVSQEYQTKSHYAVSDGWL